MRKSLRGAAVGAGLPVASAGSQVHADSQEDHNRCLVQHVLLISIDGMPTILAALGLDPGKLTAVHKEGTQVLRGLGLDGGKSLW